MKKINIGTDFNRTIKLAIDLNENEENESILKIITQQQKSNKFHCYRKGALNESHLYSILSCYYFNVYGKKNKIILWLENNIQNEYNVEISKYATIKHFSFKNEKKKTCFLETYDFDIQRESPHDYFNFIKYLLLYNYGGMWFDLNCFLLRNFDPIFSNYGNEICVYQGHGENYLEHSIFISLQPKSEKMKKNMNFIIEQKLGWKFYFSMMDDSALKLDMLVLPRGWFDPIAIKNPYNPISLDNIFENTDKKYNFDSFFYGCFCFNWHNQKIKEIQENSIIKQLVQIIQFLLRKGIMPYFIKYYENYI